MDAAGNVFIAGSRANIKEVGPSGWTFAGKHWVVFRRD